MCTVQASVIVLPAFRKRRLLPSSLHPHLATQQELPCSKDLILIHESLESKGYMMLEWESHLTVGNCFPGNLHTESPARCENAGTSPGGTTVGTGTTPTLCVVFEHSLTPVASFLLPKIIRSNLDGSSFSLI